MNSAGSRNGIPVPPPGIPRNLTRLAVLLGVAAVLVGGVIAYGSYSVSRTFALRDISEDSLHLAAILAQINATLDLSRFEERQAPLNLQDVVVSELLNEIDADVREWLSNPSLSFAWQVAPHLPALRTDPMKLKVLLKNLIGNAIKFTDHGSVSVTVTTVDDRIEFAVRDTGVGIASDVLPVIFEPFRQGDSSSTRRHGGVGLGLYIVRRIVDSLGGSIGVDGVVGHGTCVRVHLPRPPVPEAAA